MWKPIVARLVALLLPATTLMPHDGADGPFPAARPQAAYTGGGAELSRTAYAVRFGEQRGEEIDLLLLVIWRGSPDWMEQLSGGNAVLPPHPSRGGSGSVVLDRFPIRDNAMLGSTEIGAALDPASRTARVGGRELALGENNVILMDGADSPEGPRLVRMLRVDPRMPIMPEVEPEGMASMCTVASRPERRGTPESCDEIDLGPIPDVRAMIHRSPDLVDFIQ